MISVLLLALTTPASAQDAPCDAAFDINRMIDGMNKVDASFDAFDAENARVILKSMKVDMSCLRDKAHPRHLVRFARQQAMASFFDQDELEMAYWAQLASLDPELAWPASITPDHPVRDQLTYVLLEDPLQISGVLTPPKGGAVLLDGTLITTPTAAPDAPHFVQVLDREGLVTTGFWQDGVVFPSSILAKEGVEPVVPKFYTPPDPGLDPTLLVTIDPDELARRAEQRKRAEAELAASRARAQAALEKERERAERRELVAERRAKRKGEPSPAALADASGVEAEEAAPTEWVELSFAGDKERLGELDALERGTSEVGCEDVRRLEPRALMGRLTQEQILCLELELRREERLTGKNKISRVLMADAWSKEDLDRWQAAVRRHLDEIDRSDADLAYIFARFLAQQTEEHIPEAIRWSNVALSNAHQWEGQSRVDRVYALHRINAVAAQQLWLAAERAVLDGARREDITRANFWRNQTKALSREWLSFAVAAERDPAASLDLCMSAAGTTGYCAVN